MEHLLNAVFGLFKPKDEQMHRNTSGHESRADPARLSMGFQCAQGCAFLHHGTWNMARLQALKAAFAQNNYRAWRHKGKRNMFKIGQKIPLDRSGMYHFSNIFVKQKIFATAR